MASYNTVRLLNCLGSLTGTRDTQFLETGLLKTLTEVLNVPTVSLLRSVQDDGTCKQVHYRRAEQGIVMDRETLSPELLSAVRTVHASNQPSELRQFDRYITVFPAYGAERAPGYLVIVSEAPLLPQTASMLEAILRIYHNYYMLLEESKTDKLTGLLNRKTFDDSFEKILSFCALDKQEAYCPSRRRIVRADSFWMAVMDIDHFKRINDTFGHIYGDEVLVMLTQIMRNCLREDDLLFRFGGEEFVVILNLENRDCARSTLERLRNRVADHTFPQVGKVTISIGAVQISGTAFPSELFGQADQALYYAKSHGRNRLCFFEELLEIGEIQSVTPKEGDIELF